MNNKNALGNVHLEAEAKEFLLYKLEPTLFISFGALS